MTHKAIKDKEALTEKCKQIIMATSPNFMVTPISYKEATDKFIELCATYQDDDQSKQVGDLSTLVRRLAHYILHINKNSDLANNAMDYLKRNDLTGKFIRTDNVWHQDEWISVSDRLPDETGQYLVWYPPSAVCRVLQFNGERFQYDFMSPEPDITHWQPLPQPPTSKNSE